MASACYNLWRVHENPAGKKKWINEGPAPDGACPSCPNTGFPPDGEWNGHSAKCINGSMVKMVADGLGGKRPGDVIYAVGTPQATQACNASQYIGTGSISQYF